MQNCKTPERITQLGILLVDWEGDGGGYWRTFNRHLNKGNSKFVLLIPLPFLIPYPQMVKKKRASRSQDYTFFIRRSAWETHVGIQILIFIVKTYMYYLFSLIYHVSIRIVIYIKMFYIIIYMIIMNSQIYQSVKSQMSYDY